MPDPEKDDSLTTDIRYAILRIKGKLLLELGEYDEASRLFLLAHEACPDLEQARLNYVFALDLVGRDTEAVAEAKKLVEEGVKSSALVCTLVRNAQSLEELVEHDSLVDEFKETDQDVNAALTSKYLTWEDLSAAQEAADRALQMAPSSAHALFSRGTVSHNAILHGDWRDRQRHITDALQWYSDSLNAAKKDKYHGLLSEVHSNRGRVNGIAGNSELAAQDFRAAVEDSKTPSLYAEGAISFFLHEQDYDSAWEMLPLLNGDSSEVKFLTAATEYHHAATEEKIEYLDKMLAVADEPSERSTEARFHCVQWAIDLRQLDHGKKCIAEAFKEDFPFQANTLLAWLEFEDGEHDKAIQLAEAALEASSQSANPEELAVLARLLILLEHNEKALPLLEQVYIPGVLDHNCKGLLECAQVTKRHDLVIRVCNELRETGQQDNLIRKLELQVLSHYAPEQAYDLSIQFLPHDRSYFAVIRNYLTARLGRASEIVFDDDYPPRSEDFDAKEIDFVLLPYVKAGRYQEARDFLYRRLRTEFSSDVIHGKYIWFVLCYGKKAEIPQPEIVGVDAAVCLKNKRGNEYRWITLENDKPDLSRNEYSSDSPSIKELIGKRVGEEVDILGSSLQDDSEEVVEIQSKYVRLFQDAMSNFQQRFPEAASIQKIDVGSGEDFNIAPFLESAKQRKELADYVMDFYLNNPCSLFIAASQLGIDERRLMIALADFDQYHIQSVGFSSESFTEVVEHLGQNNVCVLDISAIVTISRLNGWEHLDCNNTYLISRSTYELVASWLHNAKNHESQTAAYTSYTDDGKLLLQEVSDEQHERDQRELQSIVDNINNRCETRSSKSVAGIPPERRELYSDACGYHTLEALSIAKDEDAILWTDDRMVAMLAEVDFGLSRVWSQLAFKLLQVSEQISSTEYSEITAKLAAWSYVSTAWSIQDIISSGSLNDWNPEAWPLKQCIALMNHSEMSLPKKTHIALGFFHLLSRSDCIELKQTAVIQAVLNSLNSISAVRWMLLNIDHIFGVDVISADFYRLQLAYWLNTR